MLGRILYGTLPAYRLSLYRRLSRIRKALCLHQRDRGRPLRALSPQDTRHPPDKVDAAHHRPARMYWPDPFDQGIIRGHQPDIRRRSRQDRTMPLIEELQLALDTALRGLLPKCEMAKGIAYGRKRWVALTRFAGDGRLEIDNNIAERAMRCVALGRKNWLFADSKAGGERAAAIYTVIETAKLNGLEPQAYIADVTVGIAGDWPAARWDELMPWNWTAGHAPISMAA
jgi:hypothetical protein